METHLVNAIEITNESARYDASVKELLADKQVLASQLGYQLENRMIYYFGRMISVQKNVEFTNSNCDD